MEKQTDMTHDLGDLNRSIGGLEVAITSLQDSVRYHQESSEQGRRRLYEKFEMLDRSVNQEMRVVVGTISALTTRVDGLAARLEVVEPIAEMVRSDKLRKEGAQRLGAFLWSAVIAGAGIVGWMVHELVGFLMHRA